MKTFHKPVMVSEVLSALNVKSGGSYIDSTVGEAGHSASILDAVKPTPNLLGIDLDENALVTANQRLGKYGDKVKLVQGCYTDMVKYAKMHGFEQVDGVLFDLGLSSLQLSSEIRGFGFSSTGNLDMRFDMDQGLTASHVVNQFDERTLAEIIYRFGEEPAARRIARAIVAARPIHSPASLAATATRAVGRGRKNRTHPATRTFQAVRIAVNQELDKVKDGLADSLQVLKPTGRLVVLAYHSLEDRIVKSFFREKSSKCLCPPKTPQCVCSHVASLSLVQHKAQKASIEEIGLNPRSRSARLRVAEVL